MIKDRGERYALHHFGSQAIVPGASAAARAVFDACGGAEGWKSWILPDGKMIKTSLELMAPFLDDHPDAPAEALYLHLRSFPGFNTHPVPWPDAPMSVRGAYETFRSVYLHLWMLVRTHDVKMACSLPRRAALRLVHDRDPQAGSVIRLPVAPASHGDEVK